MNPAGAIYSRAPKKIRNLRARRGGQATNVQVTRRRPSPPAETGRRRNGCLLVRRTAAGKNFGCRRRRFSRPGTVSACGR